jgi:hypothetical protein
VSRVEEEKPLRKENRKEKEKEKKREREKKKKEGKRETNEILKMRFSRLAPNSRGRGAIWPMISAKR